MLIFLNIFTSPDAGLLSVALYLLSVFFFIFGITSILGFYIRRWWNHNELAFENVKISLRQGFLFAGFACSLLALRGFRVLNFVDAAILVIAFILLEMYSKTRN